ncbi:hypothetical protein [Acinetobacter sp. YH01009]|uniref:hypothetical protein n=1 Tax=Acinetobacter sp. YH01009 TaxID=2601025 RepID=UPI0015D35AF9|nr:hypothetical protein [Acinetobacter sp. YH01009]
MRYSAKREAKNAQAPAPIESIIPLLDPVKIYSAKELAAMPLSQMNAAIEAQESYYILEHTTQMGGRAISIRRQMQNGEKLVQVKEKSRVRYKINNEFVEPRIIRQLEKRGLVKLECAK